MAGHSYVRSIGKPYLHTRVEGWDLMLEVAAIKYIVY